MVWQNRDRVEQPIRLSIVTQFYPPDYAATGQLIEELAQQLGTSAVKVQIFTGQPGYAFQSDSAPMDQSVGSIKIKRSRTSRLWPRRIRGRAINGLFFFFRAIIRLLDPRYKTDVVMVTTEPPYLGIAAYFIHSLVGIPYICLLYDLYPDVAVALKVLPGKHWITRLWDHLNRKVWKRAEKIVVLSSTMRQRILEKSPGLEDKIAIVHNWADPNIIQPLPKSDNWFSQEYNLDSKFTVLYSGNMGRCHDILTIIETVKILKDEPIQFVFIGNGAKRQNCIDTFTDLGIQNCLFLPYQDRQVLPYSLTACDLNLISIDREMEGLVAPSKLYSSLASGRPIAAICPADSYLRDIVLTSHCGIAIENGDAKGLANFIVKLSQDAILGKQMGENGRKYMLENFTPECIAEQYLQIILDCMALSSTRSIPRTTVPSSPSSTGESFLKKHQTIPKSRQAQKF